LVVVAWLVPFLVHLIPWAGRRPLGVLTCINWLLVVICPKTDTWERE